MISLDLFLGQTHGLPRKDSSLASAVTPHAKGHQFNVPDVSLSLSLSFFQGPSPDSSPLLRGDPDCEHGSGDRDQLDRGQHQTDRRVDRIQDALRHGGVQVGQALVSDLWERADSVECHQDVHDLSLHE